MRVHCRWAFVVLFPVLWIGSAWAVPALVPQQGRMLDTSGQPLDGQHSLSLALYDQATDGAEQWSETQVLDFEAGYYALTLGSIIPLDEDLFAGGPLWLELALDGVVLQPRQQVGSVPWALRAGSAGSLDGGAVNADDLSVGGVQVIDSSGAWVGPTLPVNWSDLSGVPPEIADGDQDTDTLATLFCAEGEVAKWTSGAWYCAPDIDTDTDTDTDTQLSETQVEDFVTNGPIALASGSTLGGVALTPGPHTVNTDTLLTLGCLDGDVPKWSAVQQSWACAPDTDTDTDTQLSETQVEDFVTNGPIALASGSTLGGVALTPGPHTVNTDTLLTLGCLDGEVPKWSVVQQSWACAPDNESTTQSFHVHKDGASQSGIAQGAVTQVTWPAESFDTGDAFAADRFTCLVAGKYSFYAVVKFTALGLYDTEIRLNRNGSLVAYSNYFLAYDGGNNTGAPSMIVSTILDLSPGDYVDVSVHQEGGADTISGASYASYFTGHRIDD